MRQGYNEQNNTLSPRKVFMPALNSTAGSSRIFGWMTLILGSAYLFPMIDIQGYLATGDHGACLYAFERTMHGEVPYQDYSWGYGPLMPYYYAAFDHLLGVNIMSVLIGKALLTLLSTLFIYLSLETLAGGLAGFSGAAWFLIFGRDFFYTYNHAGGITCLALIMFSAARYLTTRRDDWLWIALVSAFILAMIKINFGLIAIVMVLSTAFLTDQAFQVALTGRKKFFYAFSGIILPLIIAAVYLSFLSGLSLAEIQQCIPFGRTDDVYATSPLQALTQMTGVFWTGVRSNLIDFTFAAIEITALVYVLFRLFNPEQSADKRRTTLLILGLCGLFYILTLHEYIKSNLWFRIFWSQPAAIIGMFAVIALALADMSRAIRLLVFGLLLGLCALQAQKVFTGINRLRTSEHYLAEPRAKVFTANDANWTQTLQDTVGYINRTVPADETFLALPHDALYYYLTGRHSPTRMLIFFDHIHIPPEQERKILQELERANVNTIVLSNRIRSQETGLGIFGQTYCPLIARYINDNFVPVARFGDWTNEPGWAWQHGTLIMKRKAPAMNAEAAVNQ